jgi:hypothetical protein
VLFDDVTVASASGGYSGSGTLTSTVIAPSPFASWGTLSYNLATPGGTALTVDVLDSAGTLLAANVASGTNLSTLTAVQGKTQLKLRANLSTTASSLTPMLQDWTVAYQAVAGAYIQSAWSNVVSSAQDATAPALTMTSSTSAGGAAYTLTGTALDTYGVSSVTVNGVAATTSDSFAHWSRAVTLSSGSNTFTVVAQDVAAPANTRTTVFVVIYTPDWDGDGLPDAWEIAHGLDPYSKEGMNGATADPDGDGLSNLMEYALGLDPHSKDPNPFSLPKLVQDPNDGLYYLTWEYRRRVDLGGLICEPEISDDLQNWRSGEDVIEQVAAPALSLDGETETLTVRARVPMSSVQPGTRFFRLRVQAP